MKFQTSQQLVCPKLKPHHPFRQRPRPRQTNIHTPPRPAEDEAETDREVDELFQEAHMPLEELVARYQGDKSAAAAAGVAKLKAKSKEKPLSPFLRAKAGGSGDRLVCVCGWGGGGWGWRRGRFWGGRRVGWWVGRVNLSFKEWDDVM